MLKVTSSTRKSLFPSVAPKPRIFGRMCEVPESLRCKDTLHVMYCFTFVFTKFRKKTGCRPLRPRPGGPTHIGTSIVTKHPYPPIRGSWLLLMSSSPDPGFTNFMSPAYVPTPCSSPGLHVYSHPSTPAPDRSIWWCGRKYQACAPSKDSVLKPCLRSARLEQLGAEQDQIHSEVTILQRKMDTVLALMDQIQVLTALDDGSESNAWRPYSR